MSRNSRLAELIRQNQIINRVPPPSNCRIVGSDDDKKAKALARAKRKASRGGE